LVTYACEDSKVSLCNDGTYRNYPSTGAESDG
jgi:hypothetical protein